MVEARNLETEGLQERGPERTMSDVLSILQLMLEDGKHILLRCSETRNWRINLKCKKWLRVHEDIAYKKIVSYNNRFLIKNTGNCLFKVKGKWKRHVSKRSSSSSSSSGGSSGSSRQQVTGLDSSSFT
jgi:hypothetical protein